MKKIIQREIPSFIGLMTILTLAFMVGAVIWLSGQRNIDGSIQIGTFILYK